MKVSNLAEALSPVFRALQTEPTKFTYYDDMKCFISEDIVMPKDIFYVVVKITEPNKGKVQLGVTDGTEFYPTNDLGEVVYENDLWKMI